MTIKEARLAANLTQVEMSELLEVPVRTIQAWEGGTRVPPGYVEKLVIEKLSNLSLDKGVKKMRTVIKGTKTIEEYKELKSRMEELAVQAYEKHRAMCENWNYGGIEKVRFDNELLSIEYESGQCYHYCWDDDGNIFWK